MLTPEQIQINWNNLINFIENTFDGKRKENLLKLYNTYDEKISTTPASGKIYFHSAFIGGYVNHVLNILNIAPKIANLWESLGGKKDYTNEELFFTALNHDLGKIGDLDNEYYIQNTEDWKLKRGEHFSQNLNIKYMKIQDRSLFLLQHFEIQMSQTEWTTIKLHDGLYDEANKSYFLNYIPTFELEMLPHIIHISDMLACKKEYHDWAQTPTGSQFLENGIFRTSNHSLSPQKKKKSLIKTFENNKEFNINSFDSLFGGLIKKEGE